MKHGKHYSHPGTFLLEGIKSGFHIVNASDIQNYSHMKNYASLKKYKEAVENQILFELEHGHYIKAVEHPKIISALGAIPKGNSSQIRLIHDCRRPCGIDVNEFADQNPFKYQTLQHAVDAITPGCFMAKVDLSQGYRVVKIHPSNYTATGLHYTFDGDKHPTIMVDTRLPFGESRSPEIFNELTQAVRVIMSSVYGYNGIVAYLDDFIIVQTSYESCKSALQALLGVLRELGFWINYSKVEGPKQIITFLGIILNSVTMKLTLPKKKVDDLFKTLCNVKRKPKITKKQLQSLAGKLNWATQCVYGGRFYLRRLINSITKLARPWHRTRVTKDMLADIDWWLQFLSCFNGETDMVDPRPATPIHIDACNIAAGAYFKGHWVYTPFKTHWPAAQSMHINYKEVLSLEPAIAHWAPLLKNHKVIVHTDNLAAAAIINKGSSRDPFVMESLRRVFWWSASFNFRLHAIYIPGATNYMADCVSRLHEPNSFDRFLSLSGACSFVIY